MDSVELVLATNFLRDKLYRKLSTIKNNVAKKFPEINIFLYP